MTDSGWSATVRFSVADEVNEKQQEQRYRENRSQSDYAKSVVIVIFEPDEQTQRHVPQQKDNSYRFQHG